MGKIAESIKSYGNPGDVTNKVLMYLLGKEDEPVIADALQRYYERSVSLSRQWIEFGQEHGVIPHSVDEAKTAELFVVMTFGLRVRSTIPLNAAVLQSEDLTSLMVHSNSRSSAQLDAGGLRFHHSGTYTYRSVATILPIAILYLIVMKGF